MNHWIKERVESAEHWWDEMAGSEPSLVFSLNNYQPVLNKPDWRQRWTKEWDFLMKKILNNILPRYVVKLYCKINSKILLNFDYRDYHDPLLSDLPSREYYWLRLAENNNL